MKGEYEMSQEMVIKRLVRRHIILLIAFFFQICSLITMLIVLPINIHKFILEGYAIVLSLNSLIFEQLIIHVILAAISFGAFLLIAFRDEDSTTSRVIGLIVVNGCSLFCIWCWRWVEFRLFRGGLWGSSEQFVAWFGFEVIRENFEGIYLYFAIIILGSLIASIMAFKNPKRKTEIRELKRSMGIATDEAIDAVSNANKKSDSIVSIIKNAENAVYISTKTKEMLEEAAVMVNGPALVVEKSDKFVAKAREMKSNRRTIHSLKRTLKVLKQAEILSQTPIKELHAAKDLYDRAKREEENLCRLRNEATYAAETAKEAMGKTVTEVKRNKDIIYITETAKRAVVEAVLKASNAEKATEETEMWAAEAKKATSAHEAQSAAQHAKESENIALKESELAVDLFNEAAYEEFVYCRAEKEANDSVEEAKKAVKSAIGSAKEAKELLYVSTKAKEASEKADMAVQNATKLVAEITKCLMEVKATGSVQVAQSAASKAKGLLNKTEAEVSVAKAAHKMASNEEDEMRRNQLALQGTPKDKYDNGIWYLEKGETSQYLHWLNQAAEYGYVNAQKDLGLIYLEGKIKTSEIKTPTTSTLQGLKQSAGEDDLTGLSDLKLESLISKDIQVAVNWLEKAAEQGDVDCQFKIACIYLYDENRANEGKAIYWLEKAAENGHTEAYNDLYINDKIPDEDFNKAFGILKSASDEKNDPIAMLCVGEIYCLGSWVPRNFSTGADYLRKGISRCEKILPSHFLMRIGKMLHKEEDYANAKLFLEKASISGDAVVAEYLKDTKAHLKEEEDKIQMVADEKRRITKIRVLNEHIEKLIEEKKDHQKNYEYCLDSARRERAEEREWREKARISFSEGGKKLALEWARGQEESAKEHEEKANKFLQELKKCENIMCDLESEKMTLDRPFSIGQSKKNEFFDW